MCHKNKFKFENYKSSLEASQLQSKINHLKRNKIGIDCIKENHKEFRKKKKKSILKTHQRFKNERHDVFTEAINKIALSSNDGKKMQSINSIETFAYRTSKDIVIKKEEIKCSNIIKRYKND